MDPLPEKTSPRGHPKRTGRDYVTEHGNIQDYHFWSEKSISGNLVDKEMWLAASVQWVTRAGAKGFSPGTIRGRFGGKPPQPRRSGPSRIADFSVTTAWNSSATEVAAGSHADPRGVRAMAIDHLLTRTAETEGVRGDQTSGSMSLGRPRPVRGATTGHPVHNDRSDRGRSWCCDRMFGS